MKKALTGLGAVLLLVIVAQWFALSRVRRENQMLRDAGTQAEQARSELGTAIERARQRDAEDQSLRTDLAMLRGELQRLRQELDQAKKTTATTTLPPERSARSLRPDPPISAAAATPARVVLTPKDVDLVSLRAIRLDNGAGNLHVELPGRSSEEIGAMAGIQKCEIVVEGQLAVGAVRWTRGGTNAGLVLAFENAEQAMAAANALRAPRPQ